LARPSGTARSPSQPVSVPASYWNHTGPTAPPVVGRRRPELSRSSGAGPAGCAHQPAGACATNAASKRVRPPVWARWYTTSTVSPEGGRPPGAPGARRPGGLRRDAAAGGERGADARGRADSPAVAQHHSLPSQT
jgi:hypothetical protein